MSYGSRGAFGGHQVSIAIDETELKAEASSRQLFRGCALKAVQWQSRH